MSRIVAHTLEKYIVSYCVISRDCVHLLIMIKTKIVPIEMKFGLCPWSDFDLANW